MARSARFFLKVYDRTGATVRKTIAENKILSLPKITREINKAASDITIQLAYPWDDFSFGESNGINRNDLIEVYAQNDNYPGGTVVFTGFVSEFRGVLDQSTNRVDIRILPVESILAHAFYKNGGSYTVPVVAQDAHDAMWAAISDCNTVQGATFFTRNTAVPGLSLSYSFVKKKHLDALNEISKALPATWYWRFRADGQFDLQQYNDATADHTFTVAENIDALDINDSIVDLKNGSLVVWGPIPTESYYSDAPSQALYGKREEEVSSSSVTDITTANSTGNGNIAKKKDPIVKGKITINNLYNLETIKPGDTCKILNQRVSTSSLLPVGDIYRIARVEYDGTKAMLTLGDVVTNFGNEITRQIDGE